MSKKILSALLALVLLISLIPVSTLTAYAAESGSAGTNLEWEIKGDTLKITGKGSNVSSAGWTTSSKKDSIRRISLPASVTEVSAANAFDLTNLKEIQVESLASWSQINLHGVQPLQGRNLSKIPGNPILELEIPQGVKSISADAFQGSGFLKVTIPGTVGTIPENAFQGSTMLGTVTLGKGVKVISDGAFKNCSALTTVNMPGTVTTIGKSAFQETSIGSINLSGVKHLGDSAFQKSGLTSVSIPKGLETFGTSVFADCAKLGSVNLPGDLKVIPTNSFNNCPALTSILIPKSVETMGQNAFTGTTLKEVRIEDLNAWMHIDFVGGHNPLTISRTLRMADGTDVTSVTLPAETFVKPSIFSGCLTLTSVTIPDTVKEIGADAFASCDNLKSVNVTKAVWDSLVASGGIKSGNDKLVDAYTASHGGSAPDPDLPVLGNQKPVSGQLVDLMTKLLPFHASSYETYKGSGKYLIGYGTPSAKDKTISQKDAVGMLHEYLKMSAYAVSQKKTDLGISDGQNDVKFNALAGFTFVNGIGWLNDASSPLYKAVKNSHTGNNFLQAILRSSLSQDKGSMNLAMCLANLYRTGTYSSTVPSTYCYTYLDGNGGSVPYSVVGYDTSDTVNAALLDSDYDPTWPNNGYEFIGWHPSKTGGSKVTALDASTRGVTLYAHWQKKDSGVEDDVIVGNKVNYRIPAYLATAESRVKDNDLNAKVRVFANPVPGTPTFADLSKVKHINLVSANTVVKIAAEYKTPDGKHLWVQISGSGWIDLGLKPQVAVQAGVVKQEPKKMVPVYDSDTSKTKPDTTKTIGTGLRNGDQISVFDKWTDAKGNVYGHTVYFDANLNSWKSGWLNLKFALLNDAIEEGEAKPMELLATGTVVKTDRVNYRNKPGMVGTKIIGTLPADTKVNIYGYDFIFGHNWCLTEHGWICMDYISEDKNTVKPKPDQGDHEDTSGNVGSKDNTEKLASGYVFNKIELRVRSGPGNNYPKFPETLSKGARVHVYQTQMYNGVQWGRIHPTESRWISLNYVKLDDGVEIKNPEKPGNGQAKLGQGLVANCTDGVNIRTDADINSTPKGKYPLGTLLDLLDEKTAPNGKLWYLTERGWVCADFIKKVEMPAPGTENKPGIIRNGVVGGDMDVNVRNLPGVPGHPVVTMLKPGTGVKVTEETMVDGQVWYHIEQGWISGKYVQFSNANNSGTIGTTMLPGGQYINGTVVEKGIPILAGPGDGYKKVTDAKYGSTLTILETKMVNGVAYGRCDKGWINMKFMSMNGTGVTGTGTMATVVNCNHSIAVRNAPNGDQISNLRKNARIEVLEVSDLGNGAKWARTPLGWASMGYMLTDGPIPEPTVPPAPTTPSETAKPDADRPKPSDEGTPFVMLGKTKNKAVLRIVPGKMGDFDAEIESGVDIKLTKLVKVDNVVWGLVEGGWINVNDDVTVETWAVPTKAQIVWKENRIDVLTALNKDTPVTLKKLDIDAANKVWGQITVKVDGADTDGWVELTDITKLDGFSNSFLVKATVKTSGKVFTSVDSGEIDVSLDSAVVSVSGMDKDTSGNQWANISYQDPTTKEIMTGWMKLDDLTVNYAATVSVHALVIWKDADKVTPTTKAMKLGDGVTITKILLNSSNTPMGQIGTDEYVELGSIN